MSTLIKNLDHLMHSERTNATQLQDDIGVPQTTTSRILNGKTANPSDRTLQKYADFFGVTVAELRYSDLTNENNKGLLAPIVNSDTVRIRKGGRDLISIPIYSVVFCCGDGNKDFGFEEIKGYRDFEEEFFTKAGVKPDEFKLVCAVNDSMAPYINDKDEVGIILSDKELRDGQVYAILLDGDRMFKQVFLEGGGKLRLHSFNDKYPDKIITAENHESLIVIGRQYFRAG
jgi:transcriptional regulator with XRE-family HTH domain